MFAAIAKSILLTCDIQMFYWLNCKYFKLFLSQLKAQFLASSANCGKLYLLTFKKGGGKVKIISVKQKMHWKSWFEILLIWWVTFSQLTLYWETCFWYFTWERWKSLQSRGLTSNSNLTRLNLDRNDCVEKFLGFFKQQTFSEVSSVLDCW